MDDLEFQQRGSGSITPIFFCFTRLSSARIPGWYWKIPTEHFPTPHDL
jgi:hypothetical protein